ncbi:hypothetical protein HKD37_19G052848 [Glycine soja]
MAVDDRLEAALANLAAAQHRLESSMDALLLRLPWRPSHLYPSSSLQSPPSLLSRLTTASSSSAQPPPTSVAPMAPLPLPRFHTTNRHFPLSRYRHDHCCKIPYGNDTVLLRNDAVKHQIPPRLVWILFAVKTWPCSVCHRRRHSPPHPPPHPPPPPPKPPPQPQPWLAQAELLFFSCSVFLHPTT